MLLIVITTAALRMPSRRRGHISDMRAAPHDEADQGLTPELIGIVLAVIVLAAIVGVLVTLGA
jgi:hypothetical protein